MRPGSSEQQQRAAAIADALQRARSVLQKHPAEAERIARDVLNVNSGHLEATGILGYALLMLGRPQDALGPLEKAARSSRDPEIQTQLAIALREAGDTDKAVTWLKRAIKQQPPFAAAFHELGFVLYSLQRFGEAIGVLEQGVSAAPMMTDMHVQLGYVRYAAGQRAAAGEAFSRALAINPDHADAMSGMSSVLMDGRNYSEAAALLRRAVAADPENTELRLRLGSCLLELGEGDTGFALLRAAAARGPQLYGRALRTSLTAGRGRFWLRPSAAAKVLKTTKS